MTCIKSVRLIQPSIKLQHLFACLFSQQMLLSQANSLQLIWILTCSLFDLFILKFTSDWHLRTAFCKSEQPNLLWSQFEVNGLNRAEIWFWGYLVIIKDSQIWTILKKQENLNYRNTICYVLKKWGNGNL